MKVASRPLRWPMQSAGRTRCRCRHGIVAVGLFTHDALHGVDISEPMLRKAQERVRALNLTNVETLSVMDAKNLAFA
jgi:tRNA/tmRNA/rRNA uracil-C5-methylase (TrmA/RlmC/RlmD family)